MIRKIHLAKCLNEGDWENIRYDLDMRPVEGINGEEQNRGDTGCPEKLRHQQGRGGTVGNRHAAARILME